MNSSQTSAISNYEEDVLDIIKSFSSLDYEEGYEHPIVYRNCYSRNPSVFQFFEENKFFIKPVNQRSSIGMCKRLWLNTYSPIKNIWCGIVKEHIKPFDEPDKIFQFVDLDVKLGRYSSKYNFDKIATLSTWAREITIDRINCGLLNESFKGCGLTWLTDEPIRKQRKTNYIDFLFSVSHPIMELSQDEFETLSAKQVLTLLYGYINTRFGSNNSLCSELTNNTYSNSQTTSVYISKRNIRRVYINQLIEIKLIVKYTLEFIDRLSDQQRTSIDDEFFRSKFIDYLHNDVTACNENIDIAYYRLTKTNELVLPFNYTFNVYLYRSQEMFKHITAEAFYSFEQICNDVHNLYESILNKDCE